MKKKDITQMSFKDLYPLYIKKAERKGHTQTEVDQIIFWLTGYDKLTLSQQLTENVDVAAFFKEAPQMNENVSLIKGVVCGVRVEDIKDPIVKDIRYLDKLIDELVRGKAMEKILRQAS